jgi:hypothetical protein
MSGNARRGRPRIRNVPLGIFRISTGHADGMVQFGDTREAVLASLAPLVAFPLVAFLLMLTQGEALSALSDFMAALCGLLAPLVLTYEAARLLGRAQAWTRFAVAFNWCQWAIPVVASLLLILDGMLVASGLPDGVGVMLVVALLASYGLWLHWFLARHGLGLSAAKAALLVLGVNLGTLLIVLGPRLVVWAAGGKLTSA